MPTEYYHEKKQYTIQADCYNDLAGSQLIAIFEVLLKETDRAVQEILVLYTLLGVSKYEFIAGIPIDAKARMIQDIQWIFEIKGLTKQLIPEYDSLFGPASEWHNLTMEEWNDCEVYYYLYTKDDDTDALDKLIAVLYRECKKGYNHAINIDGDCRIPFNQYQANYQATYKIKQWPEAIKMAILAWYDGCRQAVTEMYDLFGGNCEGANEPGMFEIIRALCGDKFGSFKDVESLNVHIALRDLLLTKIENERLEAQLKSTS
jgi:hypothetical protein